MRKLWTAKEIKWLKSNYADTPTHKVAVHLGRNKESVFSKVSILGLHKSEAFKKSPFSGRLTPGAQLGGGTKFKQGHNTWNKGLKLGSEWGGEKAKAQRFKKGMLPHNTKKDGAIAVRAQSKTETAYKWIRIAKGNWRELHRVVWEKANGPIAEGLLVKFKDKNTMNCELANLYLSTKENNMLENNMHNYPAEVKRGLVAVNKLKRKIKNYEKQD